MIWNCLFVVGVAALFVDRINADCVLNLNEDFGSPSPVFLRHASYLAPDHRGEVRLRRNENVLVGCPGDKQSVLLGNESTGLIDLTWCSQQHINLRHASYLAPDHRGEVRLRRNDNVLVGCPGDKQSVLLGNESTGLIDLTVQCVQNKTVRHGATWVGNFKDIRCKTQPHYGTQENGTCVGNRRNYRVGYTVKKVFYTLYEACFDGNLLSTLYVKHRVSPASLFIQNGNRPNFIEGTLFGKTSMSHLYKVANQKTRFSALLGDEISQQYFSKDQYLNRGHLAPRADFSLRAEQRASFHYVNTAPQWRRGNAGDWAALEDGIRRRAKRGNLTLTVYTGTHGVLNLTNADKVPTPIHLATDDNNNHIVPVPFYFYKLVYEPISKTATAFVMINTPNINNAAILRATFCNDVCEDNLYFAWLRWRNRGTHSFCCSYQDFVGHVRHLPTLDVKGLFY